MNSRWGPEELARLEALDAAMAGAAAAPAAAAPAAAGPAAHPAYAKRTEAGAKLSSRWGPSELDRIAA